MTHAILFEITAEGTPHSATGARVATLIRSRIGFRKGRPPTKQFILGVIFFVIVVGLVDAGLPWPAPKGRSR
jgi:hypothetical protein